MKVSMVSSSILCFHNHQAFVLVYGLGSYYTQLKVESLQHTPQLNM